MEISNRYSLSLTDTQVNPLNTDTKEFRLTHTYTRRGLYSFRVFGFDERNYAEALMDLTIFKMDCMAPMVFIPVNQTSFLNWDKIPTIEKSKSFQVAAKASVECNGTIPT